MSQQNEAGLAPAFSCQPGVRKTGDVPLTDALTKIRELEDRLLAAKAAEKAALAKLARLNQDTRLELGEFNVRLRAAIKAREASDAIHAELKAHLRRFYAA